MLPQNVNNAGVTFVNADSTTAKTVFTAGSNDSICDMMTLCTDDTSSVNMHLYANDGSTNYLIGTVRAVTLSGTDGAANAIDMLNSTACPHLSINDAGKRCIKVKTGWVLKVAPVAAVTSGKTAWIFAAGDDF